MPSSSWSRNLHHLLVERREKHLSRDWLLEVAAQVTRALVHCHQRKALHLDANVLVTSKDICKLGDFGYSVLMAKSGTPVNTKAFLLGTPGYQAPELLLGKPPVQLVMSKA